MMMANKRIKGDISVLGEELVVEILCRLGCVKSAIKCKLVCKLWCSLVVNTDSYWLHHWRRINYKKEPAVTLFTVYRRCTESTFRFSGPRLVIDCNASGVNLDFLPCRKVDDKPICVLGSHKDLLLCCPHRTDHSCYYICNPLTKQWTALPPPPPVVAPPRRRPTEEEETRLNLRTKVGFTIYGGRLTVVRIIPFHLLQCGELHDRKVRISVLDLDSNGNGGWREVGERWGAMFEGWRCCKKMVSYKGRVVWLVKSTTIEDFRLFSSDFDSNEYTRLPLTPGYPTIEVEEWGSKTKMGVCKGRLRLAQFVDQFRKLSVWEFKDARQDWDMVREVDLEEAGKGSKEWLWARSFYEREKWFRIFVPSMAFHPEDEDILYMIVTMMGGYLEWRSHLFMYDLNKNTLDLIRNFPSYAGYLKIFPLVHQSWPTPVPRLPSKQHCCCWIG